MKNTVRWQKTTDIDHSGRAVPESHRSSLFRGSKNEILPRHHSSLARKITESRSRCQTREKSEDRGYCLIFLREKLAREY